LKKEAKTFATSGARRLTSAYLKEQKFFGSFFQKRTASCNAIGQADADSVRIK
jgi:hypothetical protein